MRERTYAAIPSPFAPAPPCGDWGLAEWAQVCPCGALFVKMEQESRLYDLPALDHIRFGGEQPVIDVECAKGHVFNDVDAMCNPSGHWFRAKRGVSSA